MSYTLFWASFQTNMGLVVLAPSLIHERQSSLLWPTWPPPPQQEEEVSTICVCLQGCGGHPICSGEPSPPQRLPSQPCSPRFLSRAQRGAWREPKGTSASSSALAPGARLCRVCFTCRGYSTTPHLTLSAPSGVRQDWVRVRLRVSLVNACWTNTRSRWGRCCSC